MAIDVFISYKREERTAASALARLLADRGYRVWWDAEIVSGDDFITTIFEILKSSRSVVVLWSEAALGSRYVLGEAMFALNRNIYLSASLEPQLELPPPFNVVHVLDVSNWQSSTRAFEGLLPAIEKKAGPPRMADAARSRDLSAEAVEEALLWRRIADSGRVEELERYLSTYGEEGLFTRLARSHLARLRSAPGPAPTAAKPRTVEPALVEVPPGSFLMGSPKLETDGSEDERPAHQVTFAKPFAIGRAPVSFAEYDAFCEATGRDKPRDEGWGRGRRPVIHVTWEDANAYCGWLSRETGKRYRLPSEAEWERAARAGSTASYPWGSAWDATKANGAAAVGGTTEPGAYPPNVLGLHDMIGNVWEWCADPLHDDYRGAPADGSVWSEDGDPVLHVIRGGSWDDLPQALRSAMRGWFKRDEGSLRLGFRVARDA